MILRVGHASGAGGIGLCSPLLRPLANATLAAVAVAILEGVWIWGSGKFIDGWTALFVLALVLLVEAKRMAPVGRLKLAQ